MEEVKEETMPTEREGEQFKICDREEEGRLMLKWQILKRSVFLFLFSCEQQNKKEGNCGCTTSQATQIRPRLPAINEEYNQSHRNHFIFQGVMMAQCKPHTDSSLQVRTAMQSKT